MHHAGLLLFLLLMALLLGPAIGQGLGALGTAIGPMLANAPGAAALTNLTAPMLFVLILLFGVSVIAALKIFVGM